MIIRWLFLILCLAAPIGVGPLAGEQNNDNSWLVVVNQDSELTALSHKQVMSLFLGRVQFLPGGSRVKTFDFPMDSAIRASFYHSLTGKNIADIDAYWARLRYSGRASPPQVLGSGEAIIKRVSEHQAGLAYLPFEFADTLADNGLKAVLIMGNIR
ncbi:MAG: hypothetical protein ACI8WB_001877 [Phenylobacterium sp.]|jgi:hypothetical protein